MAVDTVTANAGSGGASFLVDAVSTYKIPTSKIVLGADDTNDGFVSSANPMPVTASSLPLPTGAATAANQASEVASLSSIDGKITACNTGAVVVSSGALTTLGTVTTVSTVTNLSQMAGAAIAMGTGVRSSGTQRVTIATDDVVPASQSGTWTVGISSAQTLATVTTVGTVTNLSQMAGVAIAMGSGVRSSGTQRVTIATDDVVPASQSGTWNIGTVTTVTTCSTVSTLTGGGVAHDAVDSGNPHKVGGRAVSSLASATMVAAADRADFVTDLDGAQIVRLNRPAGDHLQERVTNTDGAATALTVFGATAGAFNVITGLSICNTSATNGTIDFRDGTGGAVLYTLPIPANSGVVMGGAGSVIFENATANTALAYDVSAALTTVTISLTGYKSKI